MFTQWFEGWSFDSYQLNIIIIIESKDLIKWSLVANNNNNAGISFCLRIKFIAFSPIALFLSSLLERKRIILFNSVHPSLLLMWGNGIYWKSAPRNYKHDILPISILESFVIIYGWTIKPWKRERFTTAPFFLVPCVYLQNESIRVVKSQRDCSRKSELNWRRSVDLSLG